MSIRKTRFNNSFRFYDDNDFHIFSRVISTETFIDTPPINDFHIVHYSDAGHPYRQYGGLVVETAHETIDDTYSEITVVHRVVELVIGPRPQTVDEANKRVEDFKNNIPAKYCDKSTYTEDDLKKYGRAQWVLDAEDTCNPAPEGDLNLSRYEISEMDQKCGDGTKKILVAKPI